MAVFHAKSLRARMRNAQLVLVLLMLLPALVSISLMWQYSQNYHNVIARISDILDLRPIIQNELLTEVMDIVTGRKRYADGLQYETLKKAKGKLDELIESGEDSRIELEVSRRLLTTLESYVSDLGKGISVDAQLAVNDEINNVAVLFLDMLQDAINTEITASVLASEQMQNTIHMALGIAICLLVVSLIFAFLTQSTLSKAVRVPLDKLEHFAGRIAGGELSVRAKDTDVEELRSLTQSLNTMAYRLERLLEENRRKQDNLKKSELRALQAQITPHFLYNTLDAIVWLAEAGRTQEVVKITGALSDFFRISLSNGKDWVSIEEEWQHLEGYLTIQKIRYRDILRYELVLDESLKSHQMLKLLIQPLVENAIYHGIKNRRSGGTVRVEARRSGENLMVTVSDNGVGMEEAVLGEVHKALFVSESTEAEIGYGLFSVDKRIKLYYNQEKGLSIDSSPGEGTRVSFTVQLRDEPLHSLEKGAG